MAARAHPRLLFSIARWQQSRGRTTWWPSASRRSSPFDLSTAALQQRLRKRCTHTLSLVPSGLHPSQRPRAPEGWREYKSKRELREALLNVLLHLLLQQERRNICCRICCCFSPPPRNCYHTLTIKKQTNKKKKLTCKPQVPLFSNICFPNFLLTHSMLRKTTCRHPIYSRREVFKSHFKIVFYDFNKNWRFYTRGCSSGAIRQAPITSTEKKKIITTLQTYILPSACSQVAPSPLHVKAKLESS